MNESLDSLSCPLPHPLPPRITMAHGGGGRAMQELIRELFAARLDNGSLQTGADAAVLPAHEGRLAFTTDSFVVRPLTFPGGSIGSLAVHGTVNDLAMVGSRPLYLSAGFILEEGLSIETLDSIVCSMRRAADAAGVSVVTGDTKVIERTTGEGLMVNTAGVGIMEHGHELGPRMLREGDVVMVNGDIARHGMAIMAAREGLEFDPPIESDSASVAGAALALLNAGIPVRCMRDCTRGGLAAALTEIASDSRLTIGIEERALPVSEAVRGACEILGMNPVHVACEGRFVSIVPEQYAAETLEILEKHASSGTGPVCIGQVTAGGQTIGGDAPVVVKSAIGVTRILDRPSGEQLPRIC